jgi:hypothetical protein
VFVAVTAGSRAGAVSGPQIGIPIATNHSSVSRSVITTACTIWQFDPSNYAAGRCPHRRTSAGNGKLVSTSVASLLHALHVCHTAAPLAPQHCLHAVVYVPVVWTRPMVKCHPPSTPPHAVCLARPLTRQLARRPSAEKAPRLPKGPLSAGVPPRADTFVLRPSLLSITPQHGRSLALPAPMR